MDNLISLSETNEQHYGFRDELVSEYAAKSLERGVHRANPPFKFIP